jgi:hypothetical protein
MSIDLQSPPVMIGTVIAVLAVLLLTEPFFSRRRIRRWCDEHGYRLLSWRGAWFYEGPRRFWRNEAEHAYQIEVQDRHAMVKTGCVHFDRRWWPFRPERITADWD